MRERREPGAARAEVHPGTRERWAMSVDGRALVLVSASLLSFGLAVLYSASAVEAFRTSGSASAFLVRQLSGAAVGIIAFMIFAKVDAERWRQWAWPLMGGSILLMTAVLFAPAVNGSHRFLLGGSLQPSEIGKLAVIVWTAMLVVKKGPSLRRLTKGLLPFLVVIGVLDILAVLEPDLSVAMMYTLVAGIILFAGGVRVGHFVLLGILAIPVLWSEMERVGYAARRMFSFLGLGEAPGSMTYQLTQSLIAVGSGGFWGKGFGEGRQQLGFVPLQYNDFIASNVGEELGFLGMAFLVVSFGLYGWIGFRIARAASTPFQQLLAIGLTVTIVITAYVHIGVVIGLLPTTGLTLPFVSYGRSNLVLTCLMTGILVNIASRRERVPDASPGESLALAAP
jgi:cell division protein FtsW